MSAEIALIALGAFVISAIIIRALYRANGDDLDHIVARELGWLAASEGMTRENYPFDFTPEEIAAWQKGWDEYERD